MAITALIVAVPEADADVTLSALRTQFDPTARAGVPAHVTVLVPFIEGPQLQPADLQRLAQLFARLPAFGYCFGRVGRFPDATYLAPDDPGPFIRLTTEVAAAFPAHPPYGRAFADIVPHLTVAHGPGSGLAVAADALTAWAHASPALQGRCDEVLMLEQHPDGWRLRHRFGLAVDGNRDGAPIADLPVRSGPLA